VGGVRKQGERVGDDSEHHFDGHERDDQRERDPERPDGRFGADGVVVVPVTVRMAHGRSLTT
jgi:hypothetical protein